MPRGVSVKLPGLEVRAGGSKPAEVACTAPEHIDGHADQQDRAANQEQTRHLQERWADGTQHRHAGAGHQAKQDQEATTDVKENSDQAGGQTKRNEMRGYCCVA